MGSPALSKHRAHAIAAPFATQQTNPMVFSFPSTSPLSSSALDSTALSYQEIDAKALYTFDHFFSLEQGSQLRKFLQKQSFSVPFYGRQSAAAEGEEPAYTMNNQSKWQLISSPPEPILSLYHLVSLWSDLLDAEITTQPWELHNSIVSVPAVAANQISVFSSESERLDIHDDANPSSGIGYRLPVLYDEGAWHPYTFTNGAPGSPWLVSLLLYSTSENFSPSDGLGTNFFHNDGSLAYTAACHDLRFILFECDLLHGMQASSSPQNESSRTSLVFKLAINPRNREACVKQQFYYLMQKQKGRTL